jgi:hypothetical protein
VSKNKKNMFLKKSTTKMETNVLMKFVLGSSNLVAAGFEISKITAQHGKPFSDGDYIKESRLECAPFLFDTFPEKEIIIQCITDLQVSRKKIKY